MRNADSSNVSGDNMLANFDGKDSYGLPGPFASPDASELDVLTIRTHESFSMSVFEIFVYS